MSTHQSKRSKTTTIDAFFKSDREAPLTSNVDTSHVDEFSSNGLSTFGARVMPNQEFNSNFLKRDPGKRIPIWQYPVDQHDEIRRAYIGLGPYQIYLAQYPFSNNENHHLRFQHCWFAQFSSWLEYLPTKDAAYCLPCYLFVSKVNPKLGPNAFTEEGFQNWKKVSNGKRCDFLSHMGDHSSPHSLALRSCDDLMNQSRHIDNVMKTQAEEQILNNRLRLTTSIECVQWLAFQSSPFRGHDEVPTSRNRGNFLQLVKLMANGNEKTRANVLENAPSFAKYTCPKIQKEILSIIASKVRYKIREDIGDSKFSILVDEARDESKKEQMALVLRYVDKSSILQERFFDIISVENTTSLTLKNELMTIFSRHALNVGNLRGQGYDGASNMRGEWNGLKALFLNDCPYAYYVHCFAHRLQLALVASSKDEKPIFEFFEQLDYIVNIVGASCKRNEQLINAQEAEISHFISINELETGRGAELIRLEVCNELEILDGVLIFLLFVAY